LRIADSGIQILGIVTVAVLASAGCNPNTSQRRGETPAERPNFIVILTDDQGYGDLGSYGSESLSTPHIDRMAAEGLRFTSFYMAGSVCTPSRAALMTGSYAQRVGLPIVLFPNSLPAGQRDGVPIGLNADEVTVAEILKSRGYATAIIGKWHLGDLPEFLPTRQGFDRYFGLPYSNDMHPPNTRKPYDPLPLMSGEQVIETDPDQDLLTRRYTDEALRFISEHRDRPFFLYLAHSMPHRPLHVSEGFRSRFSDEELSSIQGEDRSRDMLYPAVIEEIDWSTGRILDTLDEMGLAKRTLVMFSSDNGPAKGSLGSAGSLRGRKGDVFEGGFRVPCVMWWPGTIAAGGVTDAIATAMDVLPTFAGLAGAAVPADRVIDGHDIGPLITGGLDAAPGHDVFFYFGGNTLWGVRVGRWKLLFERQRIERDPPEIWGRRTGPVIRKALFDLEADTGETTDVSDRHPEIVMKMLSDAEEFERGLWASSRRVGEASSHPPIR
jgi:arylsulfatase A-like enzyme